MAGESFNIVTYRYFEKCLFVCFFFFLVRYNVLKSMVTQTVTSILSESESAFLFSCLLFFITHWSEQTNLMRKSDWIFVLNFRVSVNRPLAYLFLWSKHCHSKPMLQSPRSPLQSVCYRWKLNISCVCLLHYMCCLFCVWGRERERVRDTAVLITALLLLWGSGRPCPHSGKSVAL